MFACGKDKRECILTILMIEFDKRKRVLYHPRYTLKFIEIAETIYTSPRKGFDTRVPPATSGPACFKKKINSMGTQLLFSE